MDPYFLWPVAVVTAAAIAAGITWWKYPSMRPLLRKVGLFSLAAVFIVMIVVVRAFDVARRARRKTAVKDLLPSDTLSVALQETLTEAKMADVELARSRLEANMRDEADVFRLSQFDDELRRINEIDDAATRRAHLVHLVEGTR